MNKCEHIELSTDHPEKAVKFYSKVFGWKIEGAPMPDGVYYMFNNGNGGGGITAKQMPEQQPTAWMPYVTVKSVKASLATAAKHGAVTVQPYTSMGDMGAIAVLRDPTGGHIGLYEAGKGRAPPPAKKAPARKAAGKKAVGKKAAPRKKAAATRRR